MINKGMMSSNTDEWATPKLFFEELNEKYHFTLDPCCTEENRKCEKYYTKKENGLLQSWKNERVYCNPPYGREIGKWVEKAYIENKENDVFIVMLLPARTDTRWFHDFIYLKHKVEFIKGRLKFNDCKQSAPFPSMLVILESKENKYERI